MVVDFFILYVVIRWQFIYAAENIYLVLWFGELLLRQASNFYLAKSQIHMIFLRTSLYAFSLQSLSRFLHYYLRGQTYL